MSEYRKYGTAYYHLPGLFEFYEFYKVFLPLFYDHREYFYDWCKIGSIYGAPADCIWGGGRVGFGEDEASKVIDLLGKYNISARLTFSNSLLREEHLNDKKCNELCRLLQERSSSNRFSSEINANSTNNGVNSAGKNIENGVVIYSDLLLNYIRENYPDLYFVSSTTKVITDFDVFYDELSRAEYRYVVPDFRLNHSLHNFSSLPQDLKNKVEFLCNECCYYGCKDRRACYENVSRKALGETCPDHICTSPDAREGYVFSKAMKNPGFIGLEDIKSTYLPMGFSNFKIEGRSLGSALILEFILYYMTKPEYQLNVREDIYLDHSLDLF